MQLLRIATISPWLILYFCCYTGEENLTNNNKITMQKQARTKPVDMNTYEVNNLYTIMYN